MDTLHTNLFICEETETMVYSRLVDFRSSVLLLGHNNMHKWSKFFDSDEPVFVLEFISKSAGIYTVLLKDH